MSALSDYGPFDAGIGANRNEGFWRDFFRHLTGSGVIDGELNEFAVAERAAGADMSVDVATGRCFIRGHWGELTTLANVAIGTADATNPRIDRVVLRADFTANTISVEVLEGTPAGSPSAPALTQSTSRWEVSLAQISVPAADTTISTAQITDERTILGYPSFDFGTAPTNEQILVYNSTSGLWAPGDSGTSSAESKVATSEATTSTSFTDLATVQSATLTTGTRVLVSFYAEAFTASGSVELPAIGVAVSGATTRAVQTSERAANEHIVAYQNRVLHLAKSVTIEGLTSGSNTFTLKFLSGNGGSMSFQNRTLSVLNLGS